MDYLKNFHWSVGDFFEYRFYKRPIKPPPIFTKIHIDVEEVLKNDKRDNLRGIWRNTPNEDTEGMYQIPKPIWKLFK